MRTQVVEHKVCVVTRNLSVILTNCNLMLRRLKQKLYRNGEQKDDEFLEKILISSEKQERETVKKQIFQ